MARFGHLLWHFCAFPCALVDSMNLHVTLCWSSSFSCLGSRFPELYAFPAVAANSVLGGLVPALRAVDQVLSALHCRSSPCLELASSPRRHGCSPQTHCRVLPPFVLFSSPLILFCVPLIPFSYAGHCDWRRNIAFTIIMANAIQKGLKNILQKNPHDVVFLSALRTPVTRAKKGGLRDAYDHELLAAVNTPRVYYPT